MIYQAGPYWLWSLVVGYLVFQVGISLVSFLSNRLWSAALVHIRPSINVKLQLSLLLLTVFGLPLVPNFSFNTEIAPVLIKTETHFNAPHLDSTSWWQRDADYFENGKNLSAVPQAAGPWISKFQRLLPATFLEMVFSFFFVGLFSFSLFKLLKDYRQMKLLVRRAFPLKSYGKVCVVASSDVEIGFAWRSLFVNYVVVPVNVLEHRERFKSIVLHELQHHRQWDTMVIYLLRFLENFSMRNPLFVQWTYNVSELQEFACDESLLDRKLSIKGYTRDLVEVASQITLSNSRIPSCAPGIVSLASGSQLTRRIQLMFHFKSPKHKLWSKSQLRLGGAAVFASVLSLTALAATAVGSVVQVSEGRELSRVQFERLVNAKSDRRIFVSPSEKVLEGLNEYLSTSQSRRRLREALERMKQLEPMLISTAVEYHAPHELFAIPLVESMYQNLPQHPDRGGGAGIWMFIKSTAHAYGLSVYGAQDERLDPAKLTDAAFRLLKADRLRFGNWKLAILAFNAGESAVQAAIDRTGSREGWDLVRAGLKTDRNYLGRVMAMILILENPELVQN